MRRVRVAPHRARGRADISDGDDQLADRRPVAELGNRLAAVFEAEALRDARLDLALFPQLEQPRDIGAVARRLARDESAPEDARDVDALEQGDRKSTRLNSSHYCAPRMPYSA